MQRRVDIRRIACLALFFDAGRRRSKERIFIKPKIPDNFLLEPLNAWNYTLTVNESNTLPERWQRPAGAGAGCVTYVWVGGLAAVNRSMSFTCGAHMLSSLAISDGFNPAS